MNWLTRIIDFYSTLVANWFSNGELINRLKLSSLDIKPLYDRIVTKKYIKKVICITKIPIDYDSSLTEILNEIVFTIDPKCKMYTNSYSVPLNGYIEINSDNFKRGMSQAEDKYKKYSSLFEDLSETELATGKKVSLGLGKRLFISNRTLLKYKEDFESYQYIHHVLSNGGRFSNTFMFIELIAPDNNSLKQIRMGVLEYLLNEEFGIKELRANSSNYMSNYAPATFLHEFSNKEFIDILLSEENLSYITPYRTHGFIGDGIGILFGMEMGSKTPFILNLNGSGDRQINLIAAPSGWGKTLMAFMSAISAIACGLHVSAIDVKGDEWEKLFNIIRGLKIDISESSRAFVNTLRLDDINVTTSSQAKEFYTMAITSTSNLIKIIVEPKEDERRDCESIAKNITKKLFSINNVDPSKPKTLINTRNLEYEDLIPLLSDLEASPSYKDSIPLINKMRRLLTEKFKISDTFKGREITLVDIVDSPLVVYSLNRNKDQIQTIDDSIRTSMISYLDAKKISIRKQQGLGTVVYYEEMQRKEEFKSLITFICGVVTGARSSNVSVFLLCNSIATMRDEDMRPITSNLSTCFIGKVENDEDYEVIESIGCKGLIPKIRMISDKENPLKNYFAVDYNTGVDFGKAVVKCILPKDIENNLHTRDVLSDTKKDKPKKEKKDKKRKKGKAA